MSDFLDRLVAEGKAIKKDGNTYELIDERPITENPFTRTILIAGLAYKAAHGLPKDYILGMPDTEKVMMTWLSWTRRVPESAPAFRDNKAHAEDWWVLGITKTDGTVDERQTRRIADWIWEHEDQTPNYQRLLSSISKR